MHVLHLIKTSDGAGWAISLMEAMKKKYNDISFSVALPLGGKYTNRYYAICKNVYDMSYSLNAGILQKGKKLQKIIEEDKPDIIHSWFTQTTFYERLFLRKYKIPTIFEVVGPLHLENKLFKWGDVKSASTHNFWIATSKYIFEKYKKMGIPDDKLFLNYPYADVEKIIEEKKYVTVRNLRQQYNIPEHYKIIGTASYIYPPKFYSRTGVKGHEILLKAFEKVLEKRQDIVLIIAGCTFGKSTNYETRLKNKAKKIDPNRIIFTGKYRHIYEIIPNFAIFVYLSKSENLGGVFESLLFEIPTVSSNRGALPELVIPNETGYLVPLENINNIAQTILNALDNDNTLLCKNGRKKVFETIDKDLIIDTTYSIYNKVKRSSMNVQTLL